MEENNKHQDTSLKQDMSFEQIDDQIETLKARRTILASKGMMSDDPNELVKAQSYILKQQKAQKGNFKSFVFSPEREFYNGLGYKATLKGTSYELLRAMARTPQINAIIQTRVEQVLNYSEFQTDLQREGWTITKKLSRFEDYSAYELTDSDKKEIERLVEFLENGGDNAKWDLADDFEDFLRKYVKDSLELDQATFEVERTRGNDIFRYAATPSETIRLLDTIDPRDLDREKHKYDEVNGYYPIYAQVWRGRIAERQIPGTNMTEEIVYYPWELNFGVRNKSTDLMNNGYGKSELEILIEIVTWMLYGMQYNGNFFKQGSNPKGFFTIEGDADSGVLSEFRSAWRQTIAGVANSHKVPIFEGSKIDWVDMHVNNKDMEFEQWNNFLVVIACAVYRIDPSELGFHFAGISQMFGQDGQKERLNHSKEKGLEPLLKFVQKQINKYIITEVNPAFQFKFTGIDLEDETQMLANDKIKSEAGFVSQQNMFEKYSKRKPVDSDIILNQVYVQQKQIDAYGGQESNAAVDQMAGGEDVGPENPFSQYEKGENPVMDAAQNWIQKNLS